MQTFLPYEDFKRSAQALDNKRLGKQRSEVLVLLKALLYGGGWANHPAAQMWRGYEGYLGLYGVEICKEWIRRGYQDTCLEKIRDLLPTAHNKSGLSRPPWLGGPIHASHQAALLRKEPDFYAKYGWQVDPSTPYYWPTKEQD